MRKTLLTFTVVLGSIPAMAQWINNLDECQRITPPNQSVYSSEFEVNKDGVTFIHFNGPKSSAESSKKKSMYEYESGIYGDGAGKTATFLQVLDKDGNKVFSEEGRIIATEKTRTYTMVNDILMTDDDGNALLVVSDCRNSSAESNGLSYTIYKVSPSGEMLWGEEGLSLEKGDANSYEACLKMVQRSDGNYVFAWAKNNGNLRCIQLECVSKDKEFLWEKSVVLKDEKISYAYPYLTDAGFNQVNLVYAKGSNQDIMVRKIDFDGSSVWGNDTRVYNGGFPGVPLHVILNVLPDPKGGVFIGWYDDRSYTNFESAYVSYVTPDGKLGFSVGEQGQSVGTAENLRKFRPEMYFDQKSNYLYVIWRETSSGGQSWQGLKMQKVAMTGELMWNPEGQDIVPLADDKSVGYYSLQSAGDGDVAVFYMLSYGAYGRVGAYAAKVSGNDGRFLWQKPAVTISDPTAEKGSLESSPLMNGDHWITMWNDRSKGSETDKTDNRLYMQRVNTDGTLGGAVSIEAIEAKRNFRLTASVLPGAIRFDLIGGKAIETELSLYSLSGQKIAMVFKGIPTGSPYSMIWNTGSIDAGVYVATLTTMEDCKSIRIIVK